MEKVIKVNLDMLETNLFKAEPFTPDETFWTTDINSAFLEFETVQTVTGATASLVLTNAEDGAVVQRNIDLTDQTFRYMMREKEIAHAGHWYGQIVVKEEGRFITSTEFRFQVRGSILDGSDDRLFDADNYNKLADQLFTLYEQMNVFLADVKVSEQLREKAELLRASVFEASQTARAQAFLVSENDRSERFNLSEAERDAQEEARQEAETLREATYEDKLDDAIIEADVVDKVDNKVAELSPTIQQVTAQLAQKAKQSILYSNLLKKMANKEKIKVVLQGDSMIYGQDTTSLDMRPAMSDPTLDSSVVRTHKQAGKTISESMQEFANTIYGNEKIEVVNRGFSGDWAEASRKRWNVNPNADLHFVMLGTNDSSTASHVPINVQKDIEKYVQDMSLLVEQILDFGSAVVLFSIPKHSINNDALKNAYRSALKVIGKKYDVPVIDTVDFLNGYPFDTVQSDPTHYNSKGYTIMGAKFIDILVGLSSVYNPLTIRHNTPIVPSFDSYGIGLKGSVLFGNDVTAPLGSGKLKDQGLFFKLTARSKITIPFIAETDDLIISPLFNTVTNSGISFELNHGIDIPEYVNPYILGKYTKNSVNDELKTSKRLEFPNGSNRKNILNDLLETTLKNSFQIPKRGLHSITIENNTDFDESYSFGFLVRSYDSVKSVSAVNVFTTHASYSETSIVLSSKINLLDIYNRFGKIAGFDGIMGEYWRVPPLKIVVHNLNYSTIEYIIQLGDGREPGVAGSWRFEKVSEVQYNKTDRSRDRTIGSITNASYELTINWEGATSKPTMFTVSLFA